MIQDLNVDLVLVHSDNTHKLDVSITINDQCYNLDRSLENHQLKLQYDTDNIENHKFSLTVSGKQNLIDQFPDHDLSMTAVSIGSIKFDGIDIMPLLQKVARYETIQKEYTQGFTHMLGHDGSICFDFKTPLWTWFLIDSYF